MWSPLPRRRADLAWEAPPPALLAGGINSIAGGGSLVLFPTLVALGMGAIAANVTNSVVQWPGYLGGIVGFRKEYAGQRGRLVRFGAVALCVQFELEAGVVVHAAAERGCEAEPGNVEAAGGHEADPLLEQIDAVGNLQVCVRGERA